MLPIPSAKLDAVSYEIIWPQKAKKNGFSNSSYVCVFLFLFLFYFWGGGERWSTFEKQNWTGHNYIFLLIKQLFCTFENTLKLFLK